jgi:MFS family permease
VARQPARALSFGLRIGLAVGLVTAVSAASTPLIEWAADRVPEKRMGVFGVALILLGFALQSVQYWFTLLDIRVQ